VREVPLWVGFWLLILGASAALAARPLLTEDTETVAKGQFEIELGFDYVRDDNRDQYYIPSTQLKYGLMANAEIGLSMGYIFKDIHENGKVDGISDLFAYAKYRLWEEGSGYPSLALKLSLVYPTASWKNDLGSGKTDYGLAAVFSKSLGEFTLHFESLYLFIGEAGKTDILRLGLAGEYEFTKTLTGVAEVRHFQNFNSDRKDDPYSCLLGFKVKLGKAIWDGGVNIGLNSAAIDYGLTIGVTIPFP
jgi:hypothetical protein